MLGRRTSGSVVCVSCGNLVGVRDDTCLMCGRRNPGLWGYAPLLRKLGKLNETAEPAAPEDG